MQKFLKSIGFSRVNTLEEREKLLKDVLIHPDVKHVIETEDHRLVAEISKEYLPDAGITVCGEYDHENLLHVEYMYPFFKGSQITSYERVDVEQHARTFSFAAACDDMRIGTTLIFYLLNMTEFLGISQRGKFREKDTSVSLSGLADVGAVLLPVEKEQKHQAEDEKEREHRSALYEAAQNGDQHAIESLTMEDMDLYSQLSKRVQKEDIYTIVDTYFMPYGLECDRYGVMGEITDVLTAHNSATGEKLYQISIISNDIPLDICINAADLVGIPEPGRRFKGVVWLQGKINF